MKYIPQKQKNPTFKQKNGLSMLPYIQNQLERILFSSFYYQSQQNSFNNCLIEIFDEIGNIIIRKILLSMSLIFLGLTLFIVFELLIGRQMKRGLSKRNNLLIITELKQSRNPVQLYFHDFQPYYKSQKILIIFSQGKQEAAVEISIMEQILVYSSRINQQLALEQEYKKHKEFYVVPSNNNENFHTIIGTVAREVFDHQFYKDQVVRKIQDLIMSIMQKRQLSLDIVREIYQEIHDSKQKIKQYQEYQEKMHSIFFQNEEDPHYIAVPTDQFEFCGSFKNNIQTFQNLQEHSDSMIKESQHFDDLSLNHKGKLLSDQMKHQGYDYSNLDFSQSLEDQIRQSTQEIALKQCQQDGRSQKTQKVNCRKQDEEIICILSKESIMLSTRNQSTTSSSRLEIRQTNVSDFLIRNEPIKQEHCNFNSECDNSSQKTVKPKGAKKINPFGYSPKDDKNGFKFITQTQITQITPFKALFQNSNLQNKQLKQTSTSAIDQKLQKFNSSRQLKELNKKVRPSVLNDTSFSNMKQILKKQHQEDVKKFIQKKKQIQQIGSIKPVNFEQQLKTIRLRHKLTTKKVNN